MYSPRYVSKYLEEFGEYIKLDDLSYPTFIPNDKSAREILNSPKTIAVLEEKGNALKPVVEKTEKIITQIIDDILTVFKNVNNLEPEFVSSNGATIVIELEKIVDNGEKAADVIKKSSSFIPNIDFRFWRKS